MRVLKEGRPQKGWATEAYCTGAGNGRGGCGALLLVEQGDVFRTESHHYDGSNEVYATFECCACGVQTDLQEHLPFRPPARWERPTRNDHPSPHEQDT